MPFETSLIANGSSHVRFTKTDATDKNNILLVVGKFQVEKVLNGLTIDGFGPAPAKLFKGFDNSFELMLKCSEPE